MSGAFEFAGVDSVGPEACEDAKPVVCRGCLAADRPLRPLERALATLYEQITTTPVSQSEIMPKFLCGFCRALLLKFGRFRDKCHSVQTKFVDLHSRKYPITLDHIKDIVDGESCPNLQISDMKFISLDHYQNYITNNLDIMTQLSDATNNEQKDDDQCNTDYSSDSDITLASLNSYIDKNKHPIKELLHTKRTKTEMRQRNDSQKTNTRSYGNKNATKLFGYETKEVKESVDTHKVNNDDVNKKENDDLKDTINNCKERNDSQQFTNTIEDEDLTRDSDRSTKNNINNFEIQRPDTIIKILKKTKTSKPPKLKEKTNKKQPLKKVPVRTKHTKNTSRTEKDTNLKEIKESHETLKAKKKDERTKNRKLQHETNCNVKIVVLSKEEQIKQIQERKNTTNYTRALHKCEFCYRGFNTEYSYKNHMTKHELSEGEYVCDVCSMRYSSKLKLKKHAQAHHMYDFICNQCGFVSKSSADAGKHYRWHKGVKYDCKICGKTFDKPNSVMGHMHLSHGGTTPCPICRETFLGDKGLRAHMLLKHKEALGAVCSTCSVQFHSHAALTTHRELGCRGDDHRSCAACGEGFPSEESLQHHTLDRHKKGYVCETCGALFNDDGKYQSKAIFEDHCRTHSGERPFDCHLCGKRFATKQACRVHIARHSAKKGVAVSHCRACDKHFTQHSNYKRHVRVVHQNLRPFTCDVCGAAYKDKYPLQIHVNTKHLGLPWPKRARKRRAE